MEMWNECSVQGPTAIQEECLNPLESGEARPVVLEMFLPQRFSLLRVTCGPNAEC